VSYVLTPEAEVELAEALRFYAEQVSPRVARQFLATFEDKARRLAEFPGLGSPTAGGRRLFPLGRFPYSILYREVGGQLRISALAHHSRRPGDWRQRR
jgi:plasmid stabilization system protein ParE